MNRRHLLKALFILPVAAVAAPLTAAFQPRNSFADGGIIAQPDFPYLVGESVEELRIPSCLFLPVTASVNDGPTQRIGTITVDVKCDTSSLEESFHKISRALGRVRRDFPANVCERSNQ